MREFIRGQKLKLSEITDAQQLRIGISINTANAMVLDISCFAVDVNHQLSDDRYFIFYNQLQSPCGSLVSLGAVGGDQMQFAIDLARLPSFIHKLVFVVTVDGDGVMSQIKNGYLRLLSQEIEQARFRFIGSDFAQEKAIIVAEIYLKEVWRFSAVGQGFNGGLSQLLSHFGGQETPAESLQESQPIIEKKVTPSPVKMAKVASLEKQLNQQAPHLLEVAHTLAVVLEKNQLIHVIAKVALVLDASGSMFAAYRDGTVQATLERMVLTAAYLDDDGQLETWFYALKHQRFPDISVDNVSDYLSKHVNKISWGEIVKGLGGINNEPPVMQEVLDTYRKSDLPVLVIFITDGGICKTKPIKKVLIEASDYPIFWQFIGLAGSNYGVLQDLDNMTGRTVDNSGFFQVDDLKQITDEQLYERLLSKFPQWLKAAKAEGIV
ncbi:vWA domain-containing protein [Thioflexithrix psekupsensis]|uniref:VWFA domain-containing protein n=1 Tax=Thioflexithrix psekupsensis TaxID=1570016 RepID=A0A251X536_9GAMM|nr:VWA domain-containing protein [Thioflexithrix psekupsensis]OUD12500.1 hypothetical protein TPSD3_15500 [Thioflexithrix psekupsensis]